MSGEWRNLELVNVRIWYTERGGHEPKPGKGFALSLEAFDGFVEAVNAAREKIRTPAGGDGVGPVAALGAR